MNRSLVAFLVLGGVAAGCSANSTDFKDKAEEVIAESWKEEFNEELSEVACDEPSAVDVGTSFECSASGPDGSTHMFTAEITSENNITITVNP